MGDGTKPVINPEQLLALRELNSPGQTDIVTQLIDLFLETTPENIENLGRSIATQQQEKTLRFAHKLKGSCSNLGAEKAAYLCEKIEAICQVDPNWTKISSLFTETKVAMTELIEQLNDEWRQDMRL